MRSAGDKKLAQRPRRSRIPLSLGRNFPFSIFSARTKNCSRKMVEQCVRRVVFVERKPSLPQERISRLIAKDLADLPAKCAPELGAGNIGPRPISHRK